MKKLLDENADRLAPREAEAIWQTLRPRLARRPGLAWAMPLLTATATAALLAAVVLTSRHQTPRTPGIPEVASPAPFEAKAIPGEGALPVPHPADAPVDGARTPTAVLPPATPQGLVAAVPTPAPGDSVRYGLIRGTVVDSAGYPEAFATVLVEDASSGAMSERDGGFALRGLTAGRYTLHATKSGFETATRTVELVAGAETTVDFRLRSTPAATATPATSATSTATGGDLAASESSAPSNSITTGLGLPGGLSRPEQRTLTEEEKHRLMAVPYLDAGAGAPPSPPPSVHVRGGRLTGGDVRQQTWGSVKPVDGLNRNQYRPSADTDRSRPVEPVDPGHDFDTMFFQHYGVNPFVDAHADAMATFALDVDNGSYTMTRAYLDRNELPPAAAIRVEEFQNTLDHGYAPPRGGRDGRDDALAIHVAATPSPFGRGLVLARVGIKAREVSAADRKHAVLTFVVDVSGSMASGGRLETVKEALSRLVRRLDGGDLIGIVAFSNESRIVLPLTSPRDRQRIQSAIDGLQPEASTNAEAGLLDGYAMASRGYRSGWINRVILCSDGVANVGVTNARGLLDDIDREARRGIELTTVGVGMGNYNDVLLEQLADRGDGNYYYVDTLDEARRIFEGKLTGTLQTVARQTKVQVEFNPDRVERYRLIGYENRDVADRDFRNNAVDAGEVGAGHEVTALFELALRDEEALPDWRRGSLAVVRLRYEDPDTREVRELSASLSDGDIAASLSATEPMLRMDAAVAEFAEILRDSYWARDSRLSDVADLARDASRDLGDTPPLREMVSLMDRATRLWSTRQLEAERFDSVRPRWEPRSRGR